MSMQIVNLVQGTPEWHAHRAKHFNASDAPAMMGCSSYKSRSDLIKELATGLGQEVDAATQRRFDDGHRFEALARPLAEEIIGEELSPCVGVNGMHSASFDGITFMHDTGFEHKSLNTKLREAMHAGCTGADLPLEYQVQMEHQAMVATKMERILFMASKWDGDQLIEEMRCWYTPNPELRAKIKAGWLQLAKDVEAYAPEPSKPEVLGHAPEMLPTLRIEVKGEVTASNLDAFKATALNAIRSVNTELVTDQDFADADKAVKWCEEVESRLASAKEHALAQTESIGHLFRTIDEISEEARQVRLKLAKLVKSEKEARKEQIVLQAKKAFDQHIGALERRLEALDNRPCRFPAVHADFAGAVKGLKSLDSMRDKVAVTLTNAKHEANQLADKLEANRKHLVQEDGDWIALFADFATVGTKAPEDFQILAAHRIGQHKQAEAKRLEAERERIRLEEGARLEREAAAKAQAEADEAERQRQAEEAMAAQQAKAVIDAAAATQKEAPSAQPAPVVATSPVQMQAQGAQAAPVAVAKQEGETLTLGQINTLLAPIKVDATGLEQLGFEARKVEKSVAKHYAANDLPAMLHSMVQHLQGVLATA